MHSIAPICLSISCYYLRLMLLPHYQPYHICVLHTVVCTVLFLLHYTCGLLVDIVALDEHREMVKQVKNITCKETGISLSSNGSTLCTLHSRESSSLTFTPSAASNEITLQNSYSVFLCVSPRRPLIQNLGIPDASIMLPLIEFHSESRLVKQSAWSPACSRWCLYTQCSVVPKTLKDCGACGSNYFVFPSGVVSDIIHISLKRLRFCSSFRHFFRTEVSKISTTRRNNACQSLLKSSQLSCSH